MLYLKRIGYVVHVKLASKWQVIIHSITPCLPQDL
uniref:Uncharacterized protein n=1 Tax=Arundo donax TaxID=35708 RepID=A0A0A9AQ87_ARUDO